MSQLNETKKTRIDLYNSGLIDRELAKIEGVSKSAICTWRKKRGLKPNGKGGRPIGSGDPKHPEIFRKYWRDKMRKYRAKIKEEINCRN